MRYQITITGQLDTWTDEAGIRADAAPFLARVERVHEGIVSGSVELTDVVRMPDPEPVSPTREDLATIIAELDPVVADRLRAWLEFSR